MTRRRLLLGLLAAVVLGLLVGMTAGEPRQVSVELWVAAAALWVGWVVVAELTRSAPVRADRLRSLGLSRRSGGSVDRRPRNHIRLEGLLLNGVHSQRAATIRLQPWLVDVADDLLRTRHGIDRARRPERAAAVLGDVAWLIDTEDELPRTPTPAEVERFIDRLMIEGAR